MFAKPTKQMKREAFIDDFLKTGLLSHIDFASEIDQHVKITTETGLTWSAHKPTKSNELYVVCCNLDFLKSLKNIVDLYIYSYEKPIKDLTLISGLTNLQKLNLSGWKNLQSIDGIEKCIELEHLNLSGAISLKHINSIINFNNLSYLSVQNTSLFPDTGKYGEKYASEMLKLEINEYKDRIKKTK